MTADVVIVGGGVVGCSTAYHLSNDGVTEIYGRDERVSREESVHIDTWREIVKRDAVRRGLPDLVPLLDMLVDGTATIREADWNDAADEEATAPDARPATHSE